MKKRVIGLLMAACLVVGATTGCGGGSTATDTSASSAATDEADTEKEEGRGACTCLSQLHAAVRRL